MTSKKELPTVLEDAQKELESLEWVAFWMGFLLFEAVGMSVVIILSPYLKLPYALLFYFAISLFFGLVSCLEIRRLRRFIFYGFVFYGGLVFGPLGLSWLLIELLGSNPLVSIAFAAFVPAVFFFDSIKDLCRSASHVRNLTLAQRRRRIGTGFFVVIFLFSFLGTLGLMIILLRSYTTIDSWETLMVNLAPLQKFVLFLFVSVSSAIFGAWFYVYVSEPSWKTAEFSAEIGDKVDILEFANGLRESGTYDFDYSDRKSVV
jgi:hypothetical protein